jgi:hypothetical protein
MRELDAHIQDTQIQNTMYPTVVDEGGWGGGWGWGEQDK